MYPQPEYIGWGTANGSNATTTMVPGSQPTPFPSGLSTAGTGQWSDVAPYSEAAETRTSGTASVTNNTVAGSYSTYQLLGTITSLSAQSIGESFISMSSTKNSPFTLSGGFTTATSGQQGSLTVTTSGGTVGGYYQLNNEVLYVGTVSSNTIWTVTRGVNGSTPSTASTGNIITNGNPPGYGSSNPNHGDMFAHAGFIALSLNDGDSIAFTWNVNVTS